MNDKSKRQLKIPVALNEKGKIVRAINARKNEQYFCPNCRLLLVLKSGPLPKSYFRYAPEVCYKCKEEILVFTWFEHRMDTGNMPDESQIPYTLRKRYTQETTKKYWVNTCPNCTAVQGDFYLYNEPDGPFFSFNASEDFDHDMLDLANYAKYQEFFKWKFKWG